MKNLSDKDLQKEREELRRLIQLRTLEMDIQFKRDMWYAIPRIVLIIVLFFFAMWLDDYLVKLFLTR